MYPNWLKNTLALAIIALMVILLYSLALRMPWSLVDDGVFIANSRLVNAALARGDWGGVLKGLTIPIPKHGRFHPVFWVYHWINYNLFGTKASIHHLIRLLNLYAVLILVYLFGVRLTHSRWGGFVAAILLLFSGSSVNSWFRLGPQSAQLVFFQVLSMYLFFCISEERQSRHTKGLFFLSMVFLLIAYFCKETAAQLIPPFFVAAFLEMKQSGEKRAFLERKPFTAYFMGNMACLFVVCALNRLLSENVTPTGYTDQYQIKLANIMLSLNFYWRHVILQNFGAPLLLLLVVVFIFRLSCAILKRRGLDRLFRWQIIMLLIAVSAMGIYLPWTRPEKRYMLPAVVALSLFLASQLFWLLKVLLSRYGDSKNSFPVKLLAVTGLLASSVALFRYPRFGIFSPGSFVLYYSLSIVLGAAVVYPLFFHKGRNSLKGCRGLMPFFSSLAVVSVVVMMASSLLAVVLHGTVGIKNMAEYLFARDKGCAETVHYIALNAPKNASIILDFEEHGRYMEFFYEFEIHLRVFYGRYDLNVEELKLDGGYDYSPGDMLLVWSWPPWLKGQAEKYSVEEILSRFGPSLRPIRNIVCSYSTLDPCLQHWLQPSIGWRRSSWEFQWRIFKIETDLRGS